MGDVEADTPQGEKAQTVGDLMGSQDPPAHFELGIELQRGINLKVITDLRILDHEKSFATEVMLYSDAIRRAEPK